MSKIIWKFVWEGLAAIATAYAELGKALAVVADPRTIRARRERYLEHQADRMDRAYYDRYRW